MNKLIFCLFLVLAFSQFPKAHAPEQGEHHIVGGFSNIDHQNEMSESQVQLYADLNAFARNEYNVLHPEDPIVGNIVTIEGQVVAGMIYRLKYLSKSGNTITISIYQDLNRNLSIKNIEIKKKEN